MTDKKQFFTEIKNCFLFFMIQIMSDDSIVAAEKSDYHSVPCNGDVQTGTAVFQEFFVFIMLPSVIVIDMRSVYSGF